MVCYAYYKVKILRTLTNKLVISTAISGMLIGVLFVPFFVVLDDVLADAIQVMPISSFLASFLGFSMLFNIAALTYERYVAVFRSLEYNSLVTNYRVNRALIIVWLIPLFLSTIPTIFPFMVADHASLYILFKVYQGFLSCVLSLIFVIFFVIYYKVWRTSLIHIAFDRKQRLSLASTRLSQQIHEFHQRRDSISRQCFCFPRRKALLNDRFPPAISPGFMSDNEESEQLGERDGLVFDTPIGEESDSMFGSGAGDSSADERRCSITLNGVLVSNENSNMTESNTTMPVSRRRAKVSNATKVVNSPRKLSVDWQPRTMKRLATGSKRKRKSSAPVYSGMTGCPPIAGGEFRRAPHLIEKCRTNKRGGSLPSLDFHNLVFELKQIEMRRDKTFKDVLSSAARQKNESSNSASSCSPELSPETRLRRSRVSFASTESRSLLRRKSSSFYKKQIRGIIKKTESRDDPRRLKNAPRQWRTVAYEPKSSRNKFLKSYSMPANPLVEKIFKKRQVYMDTVGMKSGKSWPNPLTPPVNLNRKTTKKIFKRTKTLSQFEPPVQQNHDDMDTPSEQSSLASTPGNCTPTSTPDFTPRRKIKEISFESDVGMTSPNSCVSPTTPSPASILKNSSFSPGECSQKAASSSNTTSFESGRVTPIRCASPSDMPTLTEEKTSNTSSPVDSDRVRKKPIPASVRRAIFRLRSLERSNSSTSQTNTFDGGDRTPTKMSPLLYDDTDDALSTRRRPSIASSVVSRFTKSRNSVISQAKEFLHEIKHTRVIAVIVLINALCWVPLIFINFADATGNRDLVTPTLNLISDFSFLLNSLLMPYIYAFCKHDFKTIFRKKFNCVNCRKKRY
ncbi:uncharacterized protein [Clytia hemisphaerica]|uniref:uncharacterized protein isoform X1 n=1 Tax=Clytia hemisphaerica TaxID=252671 RepID=UPI0034D5E08A